MTHGHGDDPIEALDAEVRQQTTSTVEQTAEASADRTNRRWLPYIMISVAVVSALMSSAIGVLVAQVYPRLDQAEASVSEVRRIAEAAKVSGDAANEDLKRRGQPPVPIPDPKTDDTSTIVAAATAQVLASLPDMRPTADDIAAVITRWVADRPGVFNPSPQQIGEQVAGYLAVNPPPSGPPGEPGQAGEPGRDGVDGRDGERGPPPTADEIKAAIADLVRDNPDALCPRGGTFAQLNIRLADGSTAETWTCVVQVQTTTTTADPTPPLLPPGR
jgi:hypothetical protein